MAKEYKSAPLLSTLDSVNFLLTESGKSLETLEWDLISSPPSDEGGEPMDIAEAADLLCRYLQVPDDKKALAIAKAREFPSEPERDDGSGYASWNQRQQQLSSSPGIPRIAYPVEPSGRHG
jgi:hypothetical protein